MKLYTEFAEKPINEESFVVFRTNFFLVIIPPNRALLIADIKVKIKRCWSIKCQQMIMNFTSLRKGERIEVWLSTRVNDFKFSASCAAFNDVLLHTFMCILCSQGKKVEQKTHRKLFFSYCIDRFCCFMNGTASERAIKP
jgi:hypothetical protein